MRQSIYALFAIVLLAGSLAAGEMNWRPRDVGPRQEYMHGLYSLEIPDGWWASFDPNDLTLTIAENQNSPGRIIVSPPNPNVAGQTAEYAGMVLGALFAELGEGAMLGESDGQIGGKPSTYAAFAVKAQDGSEMVGSISAIEADEDYGVVISFMAPNDDKYSQFATILAPSVVNSYVLDPNRLRVWAKPLQNVADKSMEEVESILGDDEEEGEDDSGDGDEEGYGEEDPRQAG